METYLKFLIAAAVAVPVFVELRTFGGMLGVEVSMPVAVVVALITAAAVVFVDENVSLGDGSMSL